MKKDTDVTYQPNGPNWPSLLDSFSLIAGQIATLIKYLKAPNTPVLGNTSCYPTYLNPDRDETVLRLTEGRVPCINHEITDYFRTKPDPEVAATEQKMEEEAKSAYSAEEDARTQAMKLNGVCDKLLMIYEKKQNEGMMEKKYQNPKFFDQKDTEELVATYTYGRGLTPLTTTPRRPEVMNQQMNQQRMNQTAPIGGGPMGNMPGGVKSEPGMRPGGVQHPHPYQRK